MRNPASDANGRGDGIAYVRVRCAFAMGTSLPELIVETRLTVRNVCGERLTGCKVALSKEQPAHKGRAWLRVWGKKRDGKRVESVHELDFRTGLTRPVASNSDRLPFKLVEYNHAFHEDDSAAYARSEQTAERLPWWFLCHSLDLPGQVHWLVLPLSLAFEGGVAISANAVWGQRYPENGLGCLVLKEIAPQFGVLFENLRPSPARLAAIAMLEGVDIYDGAAPIALARGSAVIADYMDRVMSFLQGNEDRLVESFVAQVAAEAKLEARFALPAGCPAGASLKEIERAATAAISLRHEKDRKGGRARKSGNYADKSQLLEAIFKCAFSLLDGGTDKGLTQIAVSNRLFSDGGGKMLRRALAAHELEWSEVLDRARDAWLHACFPS